MAIYLDVNQFNFEKVQEAGKHSFFLEISPAGSGEQIGIPLLLANGAHPGKTLVVFAAVHGDELEGVQAIHDVFRELETNEMSGRLIAVPVANLPAFRAVQRISPIDSMNLARTFDRDRSVDLGRVDDRSERPAAGAAQCAEMALVERRDRRGLEAGCESDERGVGEAHSEIGVLVRDLRHRGEHGIPPHDEIGTSPDVAAERVSKRRSGARGEVVDLGENHGRRRKLVVDVAIPPAGFGVTAVAAVE